MGHNYIGRNYIRLTFTGRNYIGHNCTMQAITYMGHNYAGIATIQAITTKA